MLTVPGLVGVLGIALIEGAIVAAPRAGALRRLERLRSPAWALLLPGAIVLGTFGVLEVPRAASDLVLLAALLTPALAALALFGVVRGRRALLVLAAAPIGMLAALGTGWIAQVSQTLVTALGCLALGAMLVRLVPRAWLPYGMISMCVVDTLLLAFGIGQPAGSLMAAAASHTHAPVLDRASIGPISTDYPDLILAAVLGSTLGGDPQQRRAAILLTVLATGYGMLLPIAGTLPATVPIVATFLLVRLGPSLRRRWRLPRAPRCTLGPECRGVHARPQQAPA